MDVRRQPRALAATCILALHAHAALECPQLTCDDAGQTCHDPDTNAAGDWQCRCDTTTMAQGYGVAQGAAARCRVMGTVVVDECAACTDAVMQDNPLVNVGYSGPILVRIPFATQGECSDECLNTGACGAYNWGIVPVSRFDDVLGSCVAGEPCCTLLREAGPVMADPDTARAGERTYTTPCVPRGTVCTAAGNACVDEDPANPGEWKCVCTGSTHGGAKGAPTGPKDCVEQATELQPVDECTQRFCPPAILSSKDGLITGTLLGSYRLAFDDCAFECMAHPQCTAMLLQADYTMDAVRGRACVPGQPCCWLFRDQTPAVPAPGFTNGAKSEPFAPCAWSITDRAYVCDTADPPQLCNDPSDILLGDWECVCPNDNTLTASIAVVPACETPTPPTPSPPTPLPPTPAPPTPAPPTPAPLTPAPPTPAPATPLPPTQAPATPSPLTMSPPTQAPATPPPATAVPATPSPVLPEVTASPSVSPSPGTPVPVAGAPTGAPVSLISQPPPPRQQRDVSTTDMVKAAVGALAVGSIVGSGGTGQALRSAVIAGTCDPVVNTTDVRYALFPLSPTQMRIDGSMAAGAVVGNTAVIIVTAILVGLVGRLCAQFVPYALTVHIVDSKGIVIFPAVAILAVVLLFQGLSLGAFELFFHPPSTLLWWVGVVGCVECAAAIICFAAVLPRAVKENATLVRDDNEVRQWVRVAVGLQEWVSRSRDVLWAYRWGPAFRSYRAAIPWFLVLDLTTSLAVSAVQSLQPTTWAGCGHIHTATAVVCMLMGILHMRVRPHLMAIAYVLDVLIHCTQAAAMATVAHGYYNEDFTHPAFAAGDSMLVLVSALVGVRTIFDLAAALYIMRSKRRGRLQHRYWNRQGAKMAILAAVRGDPDTAPLRISIPPCGLDCSGSAQNTPNGGPMDTPGCVRGAATMGSPEEKNISDSCQDTTLDKSDLACRTVTSINIDTPSLQPLSVPEAPRGGRSSPFGVGRFTVNRTRSSTHATPRMTVSPISDPASAKIMPRRMILSPSTDSLRGLPPPRRAGSAAHRTDTDTSRDNVGAKRMESDLGAKFVDLSGDLSSGELMRDTSTGHLMSARSLNGATDDLERSVSAIPLAAKDGMQRSVRFTSQGRGVTLSERMRRGGRSPSPGLLPKGGSAVSFVDGTAAAPAPAGVAADAAASPPTRALRAGSPQPRGGLSAIGDSSLVTSAQAAGGKRARKKAQTLVR